MAVALSDRMLGGILKRQPDLLKPFDMYGTFIRIPGILFCLFLSSFLASALYSVLLYARPDITQRDVMPF